MNRVSTAIGKLQKKVDAMLLSGVDSLGKPFNQNILEESSKECNMDAATHATCQNLKSAVMGLYVSEEEAQTLYALLGNTVEQFNEQNFIVKYVLTIFFFELAETVKNNIDKSASF